LTKESYAEEDLSTEEDSPETRARLLKEDEHPRRPAGLESAAD